MHRRFFKCGKCEDFESAGAKGGFLAAKAGTAGFDDVIIEPAGDSVQLVLLAKG